MWTLVCLVTAAVPGVVAWWTGRRLLARRDDPALPERIVARSRRLVQTMAAAIAVILFAGSPWMLVLPILGFYVGGFPAHKALHEERRGLLSYLLASARWWLAALGIWTLLAFTPAIILAAGPARWHIAALLAVVLVSWNLGYTEILRRVLGAGPVAREDLAPRFAAIVAAARTAAPRVLRFGFRGGRVVNAFALPSRRRGTVLFGDQLLELLEPEEAAAIFAHEVAHLEHFDGKRLLRARLTMWLIIGLTVAVVPLADQWALGLSRALESAWVVAVGLGILMMGAARQKHEADSDLRAVELCGDPEALVRALVKLHALAHMPRRWALDFERYASHPSLARRVQLIRAAVHTPPAQLDRPVVVPGAAPGTFVVLDSERAEWLEGVAAGTALDVYALREHASRSQRWRYSELIELRVQPGSGDTVSLVATERSGSTRSMALRSDDVAMVQSALDVVDVRLAQRPMRAPIPSLLVRAVAAVAMLSAFVAGSTLSVFVAGLIAIVRPHVAPLAALAAASIGAALLSASRGDSRAEGPAPATILLALLGAVALAALLVLRRGQANAGDPHRRIVGLTSGALAVVAVASMIPLLFRSDARPLDHWGFMMTVPSVFIAASGAGGALLARDRWWARWTGIGLVVVGIVPLGLGAAWPSVRSAIQWQHATPMLLYQTQLERYGTDLRSAPSGRRLAVRIVRGVPREAPWTFRILGAANDPVELVADDLMFLDDERLVVLRREDTALRLALWSAGGAAAPAWRVTIPEMAGAHLTVVPATGAWTVVGTERESDAAVVSVAGVVGSQETHVKRWAPPSESDERSAWTVTGGESAFEVRTRLRADWYWRWPLVPTFLGRMPLDSEIWHRGPAGDRRVAGTAGVIRCMPPADKTVVCLGYGTTERIAWVFRDGSPEAGPPAILPASIWKVGLFENRLVATTSINSVLILDADGQRGLQLRLAPETGRSLDAVLAGGRLAVLSSRPPGGVVSVYAVP